MTQKKYTKVVVLIALCISVCTGGCAFSAQKWESVRALHLSDRDQEVLEKFFHQLFLSSAGYVLYGNKAMSFTTFNKLQILDGYKPKPLYGIGMSLCDTYNPLNQALVRGWNIWNKRFSSLKSDFVFKTCACSVDKSATDLFFISKKNFVFIVEQNEELFKQRLTHFTNASEFLQTCLDSKNMLKDALQNDEVLLGILLGYGRHNAEHYGKREALLKQIEKLAENNPQYSKIKEELDQLAQQLKPSFSMSYFDLWECPIERLLQFLPLPQFMADPSSEETKCLITSYEETRARIQQIYKGQKFLEQTLLQIFPSDSK